MPDKILRPKVIGERAVREVIKFEHKRGWEAKDVSLDKNYCYDIVSINRKNKSQRRCIEVKGKIGQQINPINLYFKLLKKIGRNKKIIIFILCKI